MKNFLIKFCMACAWLLIIVAGALHYYKIADIPYGFHVDEMSGSVTVGCMVTEGTDAHHIRYPLFADLHYGTPKPPVYLYPAMLWGKIFGYNVASLRSLSVTLHLLGLVGIFFLARLLFGYRYALFVLLAASVSPWVFVPSRVAFESLFAITLLIWGMWVALRSSRWPAWAIAGFIFSAAMYAYPPTRLQVPVFLVAFIAYSFSRQGFCFKRLFALTLPMVITLIPLVQKTLNGQLQQRFNTISIFSKEYLERMGKTGSLKDLLEIAWNNYWLHFNPKFLFISGDPSMVHSTGHHGILSWLDLGAMAVAVIFILILFKKDRALNPLAREKFFILFCVANAFIGIAPVALTNSELPNSLRIAGAWPFVCLLTGFLLWQICERCWALWLVVVLSACIFAGGFFKVYFNDYPRESKGMFWFWTLEEANHAKTKQDWLQFMYHYRYSDYHVRYFLMQYQGVTCTEGRDMWDNLRKFLVSQGKY